MELTRRSFVEGAALGTMGVLAATGWAAAAEGAGDEPAQDETPKMGTSFTPGTYMGSAMGNHGTVYMKVVLGEGGPGSRPRIDEVAVVGHSDTDHVMYEVEKVMPQRIVDAQSTKVDTMAGATMSSNAILYAVEDALEQAGVDPESLVAPSVESSDETVSCEALVVGAGCAGMITAVALQKRGVDTLLVDQLDMIGGTGRFSGGNMFGTMDASEQSRIYDIFMRQTVSGITEYDATLFPNMDKVNQFVSTMTEVFDYLKNDLGLSLMYYGVAGTTGDLECKVRIAENDYEAVSAIKGFQLLSTLRDVYLGLGGTLRLGTKVESLVQDGQGAVTGAVASTRTGSLKIDADYVVVCSGSASANAEVLSKFGASLRAGDPHTISIGDDGSGIEMMVDAGAQAIPDWLFSSRTLSVCPELACTSMGQDGGSGFMVGNSYAGKTTLYVNGEGRRLAREDNSNNTLLFCTDDAPDHLFAVMDVDNAASRGIVVDLEKGLVERPGYFFRADTVEGLAEAAGIDVGALAETVERYNASCDAGEDEEFGKPAECLLPVRTAPFYAVCETFVDRDVCGGVFTDLDRRVLDAGGEPIANLFAAGMCAARDTFANVDPGSCSIGTAVTAGYIAANRIADLLGK